METLFLAAGIVIIIILFVVGIKLERKRKNATTLKYQAMSADEIMQECEKKWRGEEAEKIKLGEAGTNEESNFIIQEMRKMEYGIETDHID